jgi:hypothetical protein
MDENERIIGTLALIFFGLIIFTCIVEVGMLIYGYYHADTVRCSWWGCEFEKTIQSQQIITSEKIVKSQTINISSECTTNGVKINCTDFPYNGR